MIYGEGWDFGEVANNARGKNATQLNLGGTGIATFNDRLRDAVRGGGPFNPVQEQGFITGLFTAPNDYDQGRETVQKGKLSIYQDWIRLGLAGNLKDFALIDARGNKTTGAKVSYNSLPAGYTLDPQEQIVYISAHDNETLFDAIQYKVPTTLTGADRTRINNLGVSIVMLSQGIPFFHAGDDMLRSKSLDGNSYNSGDWYNKLDFTYQGNNWAVGLPDFRTDAYDLMRKLFDNPSLKVTSEDIQFANAYFREMLEIRKSSPLFRLRTGEQVLQHLTFPDTQENRVPGLIVMVLDDTQGGDIDPNYEKIVVAFNAAGETATFADTSLQGLALELHPLQAASVDNLVKDAKFDPAKGELSIPGRTTVVFVVKQTSPEPTITPEGYVEPTAVPQPTLAPTGAPAPAATEPAPATPAKEFPWLPVSLGMTAVLVGVWAWIRGRKTK